MGAAAIRSLHFSGLLRGKTSGRGSGSANNQSENRQESHQSSPEKQRNPSASPDTHSKTCCESIPDEGGSSAITSHRPFYPGEKKARVKSLKTATAKEIKPGDWKESAEFNASDAPGQSQPFPHQKMRKRIFTIYLIFHVARPRTCGHFKDNEDPVSIDRFPYRLARTAGSSLVAIPQSLFYQQVTPIISHFNRRNRRLLRSSLPISRDSNDDFQTLHSQWIAPGIRKTAPFCDFLDL